MAKKLAKKWTKYDMLIRAKATTSRLLEIGQGYVRMEGSNKGAVAGKYYNARHMDTVESTMQLDGTAQMTVRYMHVTNRGDVVVGTGSATQQPADSKGVAKFAGEGMMWTASTRLFKLNGKRWTCEGDYNARNETVEVRGTIDMSSNKSPTSI
jgi:hypothetical protein